METLVQLAKRNAAIRRELERKFNVELPPDDLIAATRSAIDEATDYDERDMNTNFHVDYDAYKAVHRNFKLLIKQQKLTDVMKLAKHLLKSGSEQVEMSDEGMMSSEIEEAIDLVVVAVKKANLPNEQVRKWCDEMLSADSNGYLETDAIESLRGKKT